MHDTIGVGIFLNTCVLVQAFYNWAIAISDRAKIRGRTKEAEELWKQVHSLVPRHIHSNRCSSCCIFINVVSRWTAILLSAGLFVQIFLQFHRYGL
jgi:hypothetical protein